MYLNPLLSCDPSEISLNTPGMNMILHSGLCELYLCSRNCLAYCLSVGLLAFHHSQDQCSAKPFRDLLKISRGLSLYNSLLFLSRVGCPDLPQFQSLPDPWDSRPCWVPSPCSAQMLPPGRKLRQQYSLTLFLLFFPKITACCPTCERYFWYSAWFSIFMAGSQFPEELLFCHQKWKFSKG